MNYRFSLEDATAILDALPEYRPVLMGPDWFSVQRVAKALGVTDYIVRQLCDENAFNGAVQWPNGWRIPRSSLVRYLAQRIIESQEKSQEA